MAFVVIMHLSPHHESTLAEMFQRSTSMPVVPATDGTTLEANSVYVIPPGKLLASVDTHLSLTDAQKSRGKRVAVDYFFRTLAESHGAQALAVVLSGAGGDGTLGLKRIRELGGLTIAQDPDEAEHPDMPRSAIATGVVDWVLRVQEMPAKLLAYVKQRAELKLPGENGPHPAEKIELSPDEQEAALRDVLAFLHTRTGRDFSYHDDSWRGFWAAEVRWCRWSFAFDKSRSVCQMLGPDQLTSLRRTCCRASRSAYRLRGPAILAIAAECSLATRPPNL